VGDHGGRETILPGAEDYLRNGLHIRNALNETGVRDAERLQREDSRPPISSAVIDRRYSGRFIAYHEEVRYGVRVGISLEATAAHAAATGGPESGSAYGSTHDETGPGSSPRCGRICGPTFAAGARRGGVSSDSASSALIKRGYRGTDRASRRGYRGTDRASRRGYNFDSDAGSDPTRAMNSPSALALLQVQDTLTALHKLATNCVRYFTRHAGRLAIPRRETAKRRRVAALQIAEAIASA
jgi:hypothetical protein